MKPRNVVACTLEKETSNSARKKGSGVFTFETICQHVLGLEGRITW